MGKPGPHRFTRGLDLALDARLRHIARWPYGIFDPRGSWVRNADAKFRWAACACCLTIPQRQRVPPSFLGRVAVSTQGIRVSIAPCPLEGLAKWGIPVPGDLRLLLVPSWH